MQYNRNRAFDRHVLCILIYSIALPSDIFSYHHTLLVLHNFMLLRFLSASSLLATSLSKNGSHVLNASKRSYGCPSNSYNSSTAHFQFHFISSGSAWHCRNISRSGRHIRMVPSSAHDAIMPSAQSTTLTSPVWPRSCTPFRLQRSYGSADQRLATPSLTSNKKTLPCCAPPLASHRPQGDSAARTLNLLERMF